VTKDELLERHRQADQCLVALERQRSLSPDEQVELARLKKEKLRLKDQLRALSLVEGEGK
jgi:uncharacterized protein YdcH (DUF465 family)